MLSQLIPVKVNQAEETKYEERVLAYRSCVLDVHERCYCDSRKKYFALVGFYEIHALQTIAIWTKVHSEIRPLEPSVNAYSFWEPEVQIAKMVANDRGV